MIGEVDGHIEEKSESKCLVFESTDENRKVFKKNTELWSGIKNEIETIGDKTGEYAKDFMKIKFDTNDNFLLNKPLKLPILTIIVRSAIEEDGKVYLQVYLDECLYEL